MITGDGKKMLYLMTYSTHLWLYCVGPMVKHHSERKLLSPHGLLFSISSKSSFIHTIPTDRTAHTMAFVANNN